MMERKTGIVITISSGVASMALPVMTAYASSKAAISKFHELLTIELKGTGILSFSATPGLVRKCHSTLYGDTHPSDCRRDR